MTNDCGRICDGGEELVPKFEYHIGKELQTDFVFGVCTPRSKKQFGTFEETRVAIDRHPASHGFAANYKKICPLKKTGGFNCGFMCAFGGQYKKCEKCVEAQGRKVTSQFTKRELNFRNWRESADRKYTVKLVQSTYNYHQQLCS